MAKSANQKIKLLRLLELLQAETDENNPMSTARMIERLAEQGISCERKALYDDIKLLNHYGYEIMTEKKRQNHYYVVDRTFQVPELRILMDAVQTAAFITKKKTEELADKISNLAGSHRAELLKKTTVYFDIIKHDNEHIYYSVDAIDRGIGENRKISFLYFDLSPSGERIYRREKTRYVVNPVGLVFLNGFYYHICYNDKRKTLTNYRVDRMSQVRVEDEMITPADCVNAFESYAKENIAFAMFAGEAKRVTLRVHNSLSEVIFDKFGRELLLKKADEEHFITQTNIQTSPVFYAWCAMFGDKLKIVSPKSVADELVASMKKVLSQY